MEDVVGRSIEPEPHVLDLFGACPLEGGWALRAFEFAQVYTGWLGGGTE